MPVIAIQALTHTAYTNSDASVQMFLIQSDKTLPRQMTSMHFDKQMEVYMKTRMFNVAPGGPVFCTFDPALVKHTWV